MDKILIYAILTIVTFFILVAVGYHIDCSNSNGCPEVKITNDSSSNNNNNNLMPFFNPATKTTTLMPM